MTTYTFAEWHEEEQEFDDNEWEAFGDYLENQHENEMMEYDAQTITNFRDAYRGWWQTFQEFVAQTFEETNDIPEHLTNYIDYKAVARDWEHDYWYSDNGHVFLAW